MPIAPNSKLTKQQPETLLHCTSRAQAEAVLASRKTQVFDGTYRPRASERPLTFADYATDSFLPAKAGKPIHEDYERMLRLHLVPFFGKMFLCDVELMHCNAYRAKRLAQGAAAKSVKNELDCLSTLYAMAIIDCKAERDPAAGVDHGKIDNRRERLLAPAELGRLLEQLSSARGFLRPFFVTLYYTGMRISDVCALSWDRVSFELNYLAQKQKKTGEWVYPPMHRMLRSELERWKAEAPASKWVFPQQRHPASHISRHAVTEPWAAMLAAAGVEDFTRHDMRKLLATSLKALGAKTSAVKSVGGWATDAMVDHYNLGPDLAQLEEARAAVTLLPDLDLISARTEPSVSRGTARLKKVNNNET